MEMTMAQDEYLLFLRTSRTMREGEPGTVATSVHSSKSQNLNIASSTRPRTRIVWGGASSMTTSTSDAGMLPIRP